MKCLNLELIGDGSYRVTPFDSPDISTCAYVVQSGSEVGNSLFALTAHQGAEISMYVGVLWAIAWGFKQIAKVFSIGDSNETN